MSRLKQLASDTAVYGLSSIVGRMLNFLLVPLYTQVFVPGEYGLVGLVYAAFTFLNILFTYGQESSYLKYASGEEGRARVSAVFSTATLSLLGTSVLLGGVFLLVPDLLAWISGLEGGGAGAVPMRLVLYAVGILVLDTLTVVPYAELRLAGRARWFAAGQMASIFVNIGLNLWWVVGLRWGVESVFAANLVASAVKLVWVLPLYARHFRPVFDRALWRDLMAFGLPFVPGGLGYALTERASLFGLEHLLPAGESTAAVGLFNASWKLGVFMMLVTQMFRYAWQPFFLQHARDPDAKPLFARIFTLFHAALVVALLAIAFFAEEIATVHVMGRTLIGKAYLPGLVVVPLALLAYLLQGWYYVFSAGLYIEKQTKYFAHATFAGAAAAVAATFVLVPRYGIVGAGWVNVLGYAVMTAVLYGYAQRAYPVRWDWPKVMGTSGLAAVLFGAWTVFPALRATWAEALLLVAFAGGLALLGVVPRGLLGRLRRRPARTVAGSADGAAATKAEGAELAEMAADPATMADDTPPGDDTAPTPPAAPDAR